VVGFPIGQRYSFWHQHSGSIALPLIRNPHCGNTCGLSESEGHELMYWQSETDDVTCVQLAPLTAGAAVEPASPPAVAGVAAVPASPLFCEIDGMMHAGAARTASTTVTELKAARVVRIMRRW
jgi:hypothetical protein